MRELRIVSYHSRTRTAGRSFFPCPTYPKAALELAAGLVLKLAPVCGADSPYCSSALLVRPSMIAPSTAARTIAATFRAVAKSREKMPAVHGGPLVSRLPPFPWRATRRQSAICDACEPSCNPRGKTLYHGLCRRKECSGPRYRELPLVERERLADRPCRQAESRRASIVSPAAPSHPRQVLGLPMILYHGDELVSFIAHSPGELPRLSLAHSTHRHCEGIAEASGAGSPARRSRNLAQAKVLNSHRLSPASIS